MQKLPTAISEIMLQQEIDHYSGSFGMLVMQNQFIFRKEGSRSDLALHSDAWADCELMGA